MTRRDWLIIAAFCALCAAWLAFQIFVVPVEAFTR